jgi:hypothetical protein
MVIKRIGPMSVAKLAGLLYAAIGFFLGAFFAVASAIGAFASDDTQGAAFGALFGVGAIVFFPLLYGGMGFLMTLVAAWLYNVAAGLVGGVQIEVQ